jgi:undecaprenyl-diphosphatase
MPKRRRKLLVIALLLIATATMMTCLLLVPEVVQADRQAFVFLNSGQDHDLSNFFWMITVLGSLEFGFLWFVGLWLMKRSDLAAYVLVAIVMEIVIVTFMKETILRPRPYNTLADVGWLFSQGGWAFPSGHAAGAFVLATVIGLKVRRMLPLMAALALIVAFSRVYIGVHYPLDVIAGSLIGILIGLFAVNLDLGRLESRLARGRGYLTRKFCGTVNCGPRKNIR